MAFWVLALAFLVLVPTAIAGDEVCPGATPKAACTGPRTPGEFFAQVADPSIYDKSERPPCGNRTHAGPTIVEVQMRLTQLNNVNPKNGTIMANGYFRTWWKDPRLAYNGKNDSGCVDAISISGDARGIWVPDIYVDNLVEQTVEGMPSLTQVYPDGSVWRSRQVLLTVKSEFSLAKLPYEEHVAKIVVASYSQDITQMRVTAKDGVVGAGVSGIGIKSAPMTHDVWEFPEGAAEDGFTTPGKVEVSGGWDYLTISFSYTRHAKYFTQQVILPCVFFLLISYMQFWVSAAAVPARAALAVIPVLIMRTTSNSIYASIPQGSQFMWLDLFVKISAFLCNASALHFGLVQALRNVEAKNAAKHAGLVTSKPIAAKLAGMAQREGIPLIGLLSKFAPVEKTMGHESLQELNARVPKERKAIEEDEEGEAESEERPEEKVTMPGTPSSTGSGWRMSFRSDEAAKEGVTEADLLFLIYARGVFKRYDKDDSNHASPAEIWKCFTSFNVYMSVGQVMKVVAMFLRDSGNPSQLDESKNALTFSQFTTLLMEMDRYSLNLDQTNKWVAFFQSIPPSERCDVGARWGFPVLMALQFSVMYSLLAAV